MMKRFLSIILVVASVLCACNRTDAPSSSWTHEGVVYELNTRQFTPEGTLKAAEAELPRLKALGVDVVWLMPIYPIGEKGRKGTLGSYYAIRNYKAVNPEFGTLADFDSFVRSAHKQGLKVVLDWVANHTSPDHPWVDGKPSDWYVRDSLGRTIVEYDWTDIAKLNYGSEDLRREMNSCMRFWLSRGVDGFRCDMAYLVPQDFWTPAIASMRKDFRRPLYFLAESQEPWMTEAGFDASYNWPLHHMLNDVAQGKADADALKALVLEQNADTEHFPQRLCFTSNHDENSWAGTEFARMGKAWEAMTVLCWTLPQSQPLIYTGQEFGYDHSFAFFEKDPMPRQQDNDITAFYHYLCNLKHSHPALDHDAEFELLESSGNGIAFRRKKGSDELTIRVSFNNFSWFITSDVDYTYHVEPLCWWTGMKTPLQIMVNGEGVGECSVEIEGGKGVRVAGTHKSESPNYIFIDVEIEKNASAGRYFLVFTRKDGVRYRIPYDIFERRDGSAQRGSFSTSDLIYLIMPDRFVNGDKSNDSTLETLEKAAPAEFYGRHGGDIAGIRSQLDYLADLGVTAIWNTPLLEDNEPRESYHGYACTDYYKIDSRFGSNEDYRALVADAHQRGIKMIMDIVTNHCGDKHWWVEDLPFADWVHQWPEYTHSNCCFSVQNDPQAAQMDKANMEGGWFDKSMVDMNLDNPFLLQYFKQWAIWWIEWADLDGLRVDTYPYNEKIPMSQWCAAVRSEYPNINIVGEVWTGNVPQLAYWQAGNPNRDGFNSNLPAIMDFPLQSAICGGVAHTGKVWWDEGMVKVYDAIANDQFYEDLSNMMIFAGNHDQDRIADCIGKNPAKQKIVFTLLATLRGIPQVLYADELMGVSKDRSQGHGGLRIDFPLDWSRDAVASEVHDYFKALFNWRKTSLAVQQGKTLHFLRRENTYAYFRYLEDYSQVVYVYINNSEQSMTIPWADYAEFTSALPAGSWTEALSGKAVRPEALTLGPQQSVVLCFNPAN